MWSARIGVMAGFKVLCSARMFGRWSPCPWSSVLGLRVSGSKTEFFLWFDSPTGLFLLWEFKLRRTLLLHLSYTAATLHPWRLKSSAHDCFSPKLTTSRFPISIALTLRWFPWSELEGVMTAWVHGSCCSFWRSLFGGMQGGSVYSYVF